MLLSSIDWGLITGNRVVQMISGQCGSPICIESDHFKWKEQSLVLAGHMANLVV